MEGNEEKINRPYPGESIGGKKTRNKDGRTQIKKSITG